jgi:hypothetical protein
MDTNEFIESVSQRAARAIGIETPKMVRWNTRYGHGGDGRISLPRWMLGQPRIFQLWQITHEVVHCHPTLEGTKPHGCEFRAIERRALASFDLLPTYQANVAYPIALHSISEDRLMWDRPVQRRPRPPKRQTDRSGYQRAWMRWKRGAGPHPSALKPQHVRPG